MTTPVNQTRDAAIAPAKPIEAPQPRWMDSPKPYLDQPRAQGALRKELDALSDELESHVESKTDDADGRRLEFLKLPNRLIARLGAFGVSFSWLGARTGVVAEGKLMVIEWNGLGTQRGADAMKTAKPVRESTYSAEATSSDDWRWRCDSVNGTALSTVDLAAEWFARVMLAAQP